MRKVRLLMSLALMASVGLAIGCTAKFGAQQPNTQFVYPNSNVKVLGPVSASLTKQGIMGWGTIPTADEVRSVYDQALAERAGANVLVNFSEETTITTYMGIWATSTYTIEGDAAHMEVGKQRLR